MMDKFISEHVEPLLADLLTPDKKTQFLSLFETELKIFLAVHVRNELGNVNKELAKKSRELFILSSDNQALKESLEEAQNTVQTSRNQLNMLEQEKIKQKLLNEREMLEIKKAIENLEKQNKKQVNKLKMDKQVSEQSYKAKIKQITNLHQQELNKAIDQQKKIHDQQTEKLKIQFQQTKADILRTQAQTRKQIISNYQQKINKLVSEYEDRLYLQDKQSQQIGKQFKDYRNISENKISGLQNQITRLKSELAKEQQQHKKYNDLYEEIYGRLSASQQEFIIEKQKIEAELHQLKISSKQLERNLRNEIKDLKNLLNQTIQQKDNKFNDTIETIQIQFKIKFEALETQYIEEKQIAINDLEILRDRQNYEHIKKYQLLNQQHIKLRSKYDAISSQYQAKYRRIQDDHTDYIKSLNARKQYELDLSGKNSQRQFTAMRNKYQLEIKAIYSQHASQIEELLQRHKEQKAALANKLTAQYQSMINDQKASNEIQIKQKLIEFERKTKGYEAKLKEADKKKNELKVAAERIKMQMQMRVDSMIELNEAYETQIANVNQKMQNVEREKQKMVNEYEMKLLLLRNEMKTAIKQYQNRQNELKQLLQSKLRAKNQQTSRLLNKVKKQTEALITANEKRVQALQKQYNELKRVIGQKTSLPEDIEALKVFHGAYIDKQKQLEVQRQKVELLRRELKAKQAIDKVFAEKGSKKILLQQAQTQSKTLLRFRSHQV